MPRDSSSSTARTFPCNTTRCARMISKSPCASSCEAQHLHRRLPLRAIQPHQRPRLTPHQHRPSASALPP